MSFWSLLLAERGLTYLRSRGSRLTLLAALFGCSAMSAQAASVGPTRILFTCANSARTHTELCTIRSDGTDLKHLSVGVEPAIGVGSTPRWSPDGGRIAYTATDRNLYVFDVNQATTTKVTNIDPATGALARFPSWSPDGKYLAYNMLDLRDAAPNQIYTTSASGPASNGSPLFPGLYPAWSPDGGTILYMTPAGTLTAYSTDGSAPLALGNNRSQATWSPDGTRIA